MKSIIQKNKECYFCFNPTVDEHHIFGGTANRKLSEEYGLKVYLCRECHRNAHNNNECNLYLKTIGQRIFEKEHTRDEFRKIFGKSYI